MMLLLIITEDIISVLLVKIRMLKVKWAVQEYLPGSLVTRWSPHSHPHLLLHSFPKILCELRLINLGFSFIMQNKKIDTLPAPCWGITKTNKLVWKLSAPSIYKKDLRWLIPTSGTIVVSSKKTRAKENLKLKWQNFY